MNPTIVKAAMENNMFPGILVMNHWKQKTSECNQCNWNEWNLFHSEDDLQKPEEIMDVLKSNQPVQ